MLQDVIELRDHKWVPRVRQDQHLKTIDQVWVWLGGGHDVEWLGVCSFDTMEIEHGGPWPRVS